MNNAIQQNIAQSYFSAFLCVPGGSARAPGCLLHKPLKMVFKIDKPFESERKISQSVIQIIELLGMYNAELARILGQQCGDIGELTSGQRCIKQGTDAWHQAVLFIETYHLLFDYFDGDSVAMYHWMRADNPNLNGTPHFLMVDDDKLQLIHDYLYQAAMSRTRP